MNFHLPNFLALSLFFQLPSHNYPRKGESHKRIDSEANSFSEFSSSLRLGIGDIVISLTLELEHI